MVTSSSGQRCFGVLFNLPVTWWFGARARLQQLKTFWGAHSSQPNPWRSLHRDFSCELPFFCTAGYLHSGIHCCVCVSLSGLHRGRLYVKPTQPGSYGGEQPRECSCTTGHAFVPTRIQRELDTSSHSKRWEDFCCKCTPSTSFPKKATFRITFKYVLKSQRFFFCIHEYGREGFVRRRLDTCARQKHKGNKRKSKMRRPEERERRNRQRRAEII